jgi:hypothetical protein
LLGSPLVGIGRPSPRHRKDREPPEFNVEVLGRDPVRSWVDQPSLPAGIRAHSQNPSSEQSAAREPESLDEAVDTSIQDAPSHLSTDEPIPLTSEVVTSDVADPSARIEPAQLTLEIGAPKPESEAQAADPAGDPEKSSDESSVPTIIYEVEVPSTSSTETVCDAETQPDRSQRILLWVTVAKVRTARGKGIELEFAPSPSTNTDGIRFAIQEDDPSVRIHFKPGRLLVNTTLDHDGFRLFRRAAGLRLAIEWWR